MKIEEMIEELKSIAIEVEKLQEGKEPRTEEMIEEMNRAVDGTLVIVHYYNWELHSYGEGSLFSSLENYISSPFFKSLIEKAYKMFKDRRMDERI